MKIFTTISMVARHLCVNERTVYRMLDAQEIQPGRGEKGANGKIVGRHWTVSMLLAPKMLCEERRKYVPQKIGRCK